MIAMLLPYTVLNTSDSTITDMAASVQNTFPDSTEMGERNSGTENNINSPTPHDTSSTDTTDQNTASNKQQIHLPACRQCQKMKIFRPDWILSAKP